jgi:hypothetical protein
MWSKWFEVNNRNHLAKVTFEKSFEGKKTTSYEGE